MEDEAVKVDVIVATQEPPSEQPSQEEPKTMEFLVGQLTEKISTLETTHQTMLQTIQEQTQEIQSLREMDRMTSEEVYRIANEVFNQIAEIQEQVAEAIEEEAELEPSDLDNIPVIPSQEQAPSTDSDQDQPKAAKKRHWWL